MQETVAVRQGIQRSLGRGPEVAEGERFCHAQAGQRLAKAGFGAREPGDGPLMDRGVQFGHLGRQPARQDSPCPAKNRAKQVEA